MAIPGKPWLQNFHLNGYRFQPYEQETPDNSCSEETAARWPQAIRLFSSPPISADHEAAVIRYLINQGLSDVAADEQKDRGRSELGLLWLRDTRPGEIRR